MLVRHGMPVCDQRTRVRGRDFARWVAAYEGAPIDQTLAPPSRVRTRLATVQCLVTSTLRRSIESAALAAPGRTPVSDALFDEAGIPTAIGLGLALLPTHWDALARAAWLLGWSRGVESATEARARATRAARHLAGLASTHGSVALVGHGMLNTFIARALRREGWSGSGSPRAYWGLVALRRAR
jgi:broad specificity phosphatase PhoE